MSEEGQRADHAFHRCADVAIRVLPLYLLDCLPWTDSTHVSALQSMLCSVFRKLTTSVFWYHLSYRLSFRADMDLCQCGIMSRRPTVKVYHALGNT